MKAITSDLSFEEFLEDPTSYGMPTFEEFRRNKEKYLGRKDDEVIAIDRGDRNLHCRQEYYVCGHHVKTLEQGERIARDMGYDFYNDFQAKPQVLPDSSLKGFYIRVNFIPKPRQVSIEQSTTD